MRRTEQAPDKYLNLQMYTLNVWFI